MQLPSKPLTGESRPHGTPWSILEVARRYELLRCPRGEILIEQGEPVSYLHVIVGGVARVFCRHEQHEPLLELARAPAVFGEVELLERVPFLVSVAALEPLEVRLIPAGEALACLASLGASADQARRLAARLREAARAQRRLSAGVEAGLADLLLSLAEVFGQPLGPDLEISNPLTQEELARSLALVRRSVHGTLARWRREGLISHRGRSIMVHDVARLQQLAGTLRAAR